MTVNKFIYLISKTVKYINMTLSMYAKDNGIFIDGLDLIKNMVFCLDMK